MAKRIEGATEKLLACAQEEFLVRGYDGASLRAIAEKQKVRSISAILTKKAYIAHSLSRQQMVFANFWKNLCQDSARFPQASRRFRCLIMPTTAFRRLLIISMITSMLSSCFSPAERRACIRNLFIALWNWTPPARRITLQCRIMTR